MVRLLTVRASVAALKRALAVSDRLRPATWRTLAIALAALAALSFWGYARTSRKYERALSALADKTPYLNAHDRAAKETGEAVLAHEFAHALSPSSFEWSVTARADSYVDFLPRTTLSPDERRLFRDLSGHGFSPSADISAMIVDPMSPFDLSDAASTTKQFLSAGAVAGTVSHQQLTLSPYHLARFGSVSLSIPCCMDVAVKFETFGKRTSAAAWWGEGFDLLRLLRRAPNAMPRLSPPEDTSFLATLQRLALLIQAVVLTIGSVFASAFGLVAYHRGKVELALKLLQKRLAELELADRETERAEKLIRFRLAQMELEDRERARAEEAARRAAAEPRIIVVSC